MLWTWGTPANTIAEAVFARCLSALKEERCVDASKPLVGPEPAYTGERAELIAAIRDALYCSKVCAYAQGFQLMAEASTRIRLGAEFLARSPRSGVAGASFVRASCKDHGGLRAGCRAAEEPPAGRLL